MTSYHTEYEGYYTMSWHDKEENALKRWFENYKIEKYASFASEFEWLVVKEVPSDTKRKTRLVCEIGDDGRGTKREVVMDHTTPPAPMLTFAAKKRYVPPPPKTEQQIRQEHEWARMTSMGYEPRRVARWKPINPFVTKGDTVMIDDAIEYDIEWVPRQSYTYSSYYREPNFKSSPPPRTPTHKRNV